MENGGRRNLSLSIWLSPQAGVAIRDASREETDAYSFCGFPALPEEQACREVLPRAEARHPLPRCLGGQPGSKSPPMLLIPALAWLSNLFRDWRIGFLCGNQGDGPPEAEAAQVRSKPSFVGKPGRGERQGLK